MVTVTQARHCNNTLLNYTIVKLSILPFKSIRIAELHGRKVWRFQSSNQRPWVKTWRTRQWLNRKRTNNTKQINKDWVTRNLLNTGGELGSPHQYWWYIANCFQIYGNVIILTLQNIKGAIKNGQFREVGNIGCTRGRTRKQKQITICVWHHYANKHK